MRLLDLPAGVYDANARRLALGHLKITISHPLVKFRVLLVKRAQQPANGPRTLSGSRSLSLNIENNCEVRLQSFSCKGVEFIDHIQVEAAAVTLKSNCRISVAIGDYGFSRLERRSYEFGNVLSPRGDVKKQLGRWSDVRSRVGDHQLSNPFTDRGPARLARGHHIKPAAAELGCKKIALRALAASVYAFKRYE